jgi:hypothetical protein
MRWPPILWPGFIAASLLLLTGIGMGGTWALIPGIVACVVLLAMVVGAVTRYADARDRPPELLAPVGGVLAFYAVCALLALVAGVEYALMALLVGVFFGAAAALWATMVRGKTSKGTDAEHAAAEEDPFPGIGPDPSTPLGDTNQHSEAQEGAPVTGERRFIRGLRERDATAAAGREPRDRT